MSRYMRFGGERAYMNVNIFLRIVKGSGMIRSMKSAISLTSRRKTCVADVSGVRKAAFSTAPTEALQEHAVNLRGCSRESC